MIVIGLAYCIRNGVAIKAFGEVEQGRLYRSRQPEWLQYSALFRSGRVARVINLRSPAEDPDAFAQEEALCRRYGVDFLSLPVTLEVPTPAQVSQFLDLVDSSPGPVWVHCAEGRNRTGMMCAAYRVAREAVPITKAYQGELLDYGAHPRPEKREAIWQLLQAVQQGGLPRQAQTAP
jgi:protein tyrosine phosphatase (PTP) superfamily phosphohydrolase (DUF442 family)